MLQLLRSDYLSSKRACHSLDCSQKYTVLTAQSNRRSAHIVDCCSRQHTSDSNRHATLHWPRHRRAAHVTAAALGIMGVPHVSSLPGLLSTCVLMFVGAYGCGMLPSWLPISEQRLASVSCRACSTHEWIPAEACMHDFALALAQHLGLQVLSCL